MWTGVTELTFLGHTLNSQDVCPVQENMTAIQEFPLPSTKRKLKEFLGILNFYHYFIPHCTHLLQPINNPLTTTTHFSGMNNLYKLSSLSSKLLPMFPFLHILSMMLRPTSWQMHQILLWEQCYNRKWMISGAPLHSSQRDSLLPKQDTVLSTESCMLSI